VYIYTCKQSYNFFLRVLCVSKFLLAATAASTHIISDAAPAGKNQMAGKAKPKKHTAKEIAGKVAAATQNKGGGKAGLADRKGGAAGHAKFKCPQCGVQSPSIKSAEMHWDSKHSKLPFVPEDWSDTHAEHGGVTTQGVAVKGASKEKTLHQLSKTQSGQQKLKEIEQQKAAAKFQ